MRKRAKRQRLAVAILLQLAVWDNFCQVEALTTSQIDDNGKPMFAVYYYGQEDRGTPAVKLFQSQSTDNDFLTYTLHNNIKAGLDNSFRQWVELLRWADLHEYAGFFSAECRSPALCKWLQYCHLWRGTAHFWLK